MRIAVVNISKSRIEKFSEYHVFTIKTFTELRSGGKHSVEILNLFMTDSDETSAQVLENGDYGIVLFRLHPWNIGYAFSVINKLGEKFKSVAGLWGHDSFMFPEDYLRKKITFILQDEPELAIYELAEALDAGSSDLRVPGVVYRDDNLKTIVFGKERVIDNLDMIPSPYLSGLVDVSSETAVFWEVSRGCLFRCDFCVDFSHTNKVRYHGFNYLKEELDFFREKGVQQVILGAPIFNLSHQHVQRILEMINKLLPDARIDIQVRPDILTKEEIEMFSQMNVYLYFGINTFNRKTLENVRTSLNIETAVANIRYINNFPELSFSIDILAGLPKTTYESVLEDIDKAFSLWPIEINLTRLSLFPGTRIHNRTRELDYVAEHSFPYRLQTSPGFSKREMEKIDEISEGIELIYNKGRLVSVFTVIAEAFDQRCSEIIERWNKWVRKTGCKFSEETDFVFLFEKVLEFFENMADRFQKKKLYPLIEDMLYHNAYFTSALMTQEEDIVTLPYQISSIDENSEISINKSVFFRRFTYDIEDVINAGYVKIKDYASEVDKDNLFAIVYRIEGDVITQTISDAEALIFDYVKKNGPVTPKVVAEALPAEYKDEILNIMISWSEEGVLYIK